MQAAIGKLQSTIPMAQTREADYKNLVGEGFISSHATQDKTRERVELERDLATQGARLIEAQSALAEAQHNKAAWRAETVRTLSDRQAAASSKLGQLQQEHTKARQKEKQTQLTAPVAGVVQQLAIHSIGGVVTSAQPLMIIVPDSPTVTAEVTIANQDIGFVNAGQIALVKLETFPYTKYGTVKARVDIVTADAVTDEKRATGNALDNVLTGNSAINLLTGGAGNDTCVVTTGDTTTEALNAGADTVQSAVAWTLATNVENLLLTGTSAVNGSGNTADNLLTGNSGANTLTGNAGNDTLDGKAGADVLLGGTGNDTYWLGRGYGIDTLSDTDATAGNTDVAKFEAGVATNQLWFRQVANNLEVSIIGASDKFNISNWYSGAANHVEQFKTSDGKTLLDSQVQNLVSAVAAFAPPAAGQTTLPANYATTLAPVLAANWQ